jgi:hypothetical protein
MKYEKLTIFTATETYGHDDNCTALDYAIPALENAMEPECKVLDYSTEEFTLVPKHQELELEQEQEQDHGLAAAAERLSLLEERHRLLDQLAKMDEMHDAATAHRDALVKAAQAMYELHKDGVSHQLQLPNRRKAALEALRDALVKIATATGEKE